VADIFAVTNQSYGLNRQFKDLGNGAFAEVMALEPNSIGGGGGGVAGSVTIADGVNSALKATVTAGLAIKTDGSAVTQPVSGTFFQSTQPVSLATNTPDVTDRAGRLLGHVTVDNASLAVTGPLTDTQIRATALPVSGPLTDTQLRASAVPVSGTFFQGTQPVSIAAALDVSDRAARLVGVVYGSQAQQLKQTATNFNLQSELATGGTLYDARQIRALTSADVVSAAQSGTWTVQPGNTANTTAWKVDGSAVTQPVSGTITANQGGAPWSENISQWGGSATTLGQKVMASSVPVVISSDQSSVAVNTNPTGATNVLKTGTITTTAVTADQVVLTYTVTAGKTFYMTYLVMYGRLTVLAATATILGAISLETPSGTKVFTLDDVNPTTSELEFNPIVLPTPIPIAAGVVVRVVVTPAAATSMLWRANFGGYEK
jgi:hypothetical protein